MWGWAWLDDAIKDVRYTGRILRQNLLFSVVAVLTLALGIGANTAIFSVINAVLLRALPVHDPQQVFYLHVLPNQPQGANNTGDGDSSFSEYVFEQLRTQHQAFSSLAAYVPAGINKIAVRSGATPEEAAVDMVSGNFFSGLGVRSICGRTLTMDDEKNHTAVAVLGYGFWNRRFARNCSVIGQPLYIKGAPFTIVGVAARNFSGVEGNNPTDVWIPLQNRPNMNAWGSAGENYYAAPNWWCLQLAGRLAPGVSHIQAQTMLGAVFQRAAYEHLGGKPRKGEAPRKLVLTPARGIGQSQEGIDKPLYVLLAMVGLILLIACGNVALLLTARNSARRREFSVRLAIGGSQIRLFRQLLAESLVLVALGALFGWLFALFATRVLAAWGQIEFSLAPDRDVLLYTVALSALAALIFGLTPVFTTLRVPIGLASKNSSATAFQEKSKSWATRSIVALQISLCLILTVAAGLLVQTLHNLEHTNLGFKTSGLVFGLNPQLQTHSTAEAIRFYQDLLIRLRALPGVEAATLMDARIGSGWSNNTGAIVDGRDPRSLYGAESNMMRWNAVGSDYFGTLGVPIRLGRDFTDADSSSAPKVAIINETFARRLLKGRPPLGHHVSFTRKLSFTIVGVAANSKYTGIREYDIPMAYFPFMQMTEVGAMHVELRVAGDPVSFWKEIRTAVASFAPDLTLLQPMTQQAQFDDGISQERLVARLSIFFGGLAVLLVTTGLYGTLAYSVNRRTSEFGIRMAIGAQRRVLLWMILRESLRICAVGIVIGLPLAIVCARALASLLYGLAPYDSLTICLAIAGIVLVSLAASFLPARRAASVDPLVALRYE